MRGRRVGDREEADSNEVKEARGLATKLGKEGKAVMAYHGDCLIGQSESGPDLTNPNFCLGESFS